MQPVYRAGAGLELLPGYFVPIARGDDCGFGLDAMSTIALRGSVGGCGILEDSAPGALALTVHAASRFDLEQ
jgi:hypothetical protein